MRRTNIRDLAGDIGIGRSRVVGGRRIEVENPKLPMVGGKCSDIDEFAELLIERGEVDWAANGLGRHDTVFHGPLPGSEPESSNERSVATIRRYVAADQFAPGAIACEVVRLSMHSTGIVLVFLPEADGWVYDAAFFEDRAGELVE